MSKSVLLLLVLAVLVAACQPGLSPTPTAPPPSPTPRSQPLRVAIVYTRSRNDDPERYVRAGFYHQMRLAGHYRGDGTLIVFEFPLEVEPRTSDEEIAAMIERTLEALDSCTFDALITIGPLATLQIAPAYAERHVTVPIFYAAVPEDLTHQLSRYPSIVGLPHRRHPVQTMALALSMAQKPLSRVLLLVSGAESLDATMAYNELQQAFPDIDFSLYATERFLVWQEVLADAAEEADAVLLISWEGLRDEQWQFVPADEVLDWTVLHSPIPLFALDEKAVRRGAAGGLVASSWGTGKALARLVEEVVVGGTHPSALSSKNRSINLLAINLWGVERWHLNIPPAVALTAATFTGFPAAEPDSTETP